MKYVDTFKVFESKIDYQNLLEDMCDAMPGKNNEMMGTMNFNTETPSMNFEISKASLIEWKKYSKKTDSRKVIYDLRTNVDDMLFGETEEEVESAIKDTTIYIVDMKSASQYLSKAIRLCNSHGLVVTDCFLMTTSQSEMWPNIWMTLGPDKEMAHKYRGNISQRKFGLES